MPQRRNSAPKIESLAAPESVYDLDALAEVSRQEPYIEIPLPRKGKLVMRTNVTAGEWRGMQVDLARWAEGIKNMPWFKELVEPLDDDGLVQAFILSRYVIPVMTDKRAFEFVHAAGLLMASIITQWERGCRTAEHIYIEDALQEKKENSEPE